LLQAKINTGTTSAIASIVLSAATAFGFGFQPAAPMRVNRLWRSIGRQLSELRIVAPGRFEFVASFPRSLLVILI
jgi:hypothetical protein